MGRPSNVSDLGPRLREILHYFWPYTRNHRATMVGALLAIVAEVFLRLLEPWMLALVIDYVIAPPKGGPKPLPVISDMSPEQILLFASVGLVASVGLRALAVYASTVGFAVVGNKVLTKVRADLYQHLHSLSLSYHTRARKGDLTVRVIGDIGLLKDVVVTAVLPLVGNLFILIGMISVLFFLNLKLTLLAMATVPLFWLSTVRLTNRIHQVSRAQRRREGSMASSAAESLGAIHVVQALSLEGQFAESFAGQNQKSSKQGVKGTRLAARLERSVDLLVAISTAVVMYFGARLVLDNSLTAGALVVFLTYLKNALKPVRDFAKYTARLAKAVAAGERVIDVFQQQPDIRDTPDAVPAPPLAGRVRLEDVSFEYEPGHPVLRGIEFEAEPGQVVALVGPSGIGKSTLVNLILRLYDPTSGRVLVDGRDIRDYTLESVRTQIGVVLQDTLLFAASVRENIRYGRPDATEAEVMAAAELANASEFIRRLPDGFDTVIGERGVTLSGGQRQRLSIARTAIRRAPILILDEPTTGMDGESSKLVTDALNRLADGRTTFLITHDLRQVAHADRILFIEGGNVVEQGSHEDLVARGGRYATLYALGTALPPARPTTEFVP
ncbi:MAG: ABC transporter ATP-binding protein [Nocardioidaceae bacterium]|nr:ABC transporter ATP-binding protein [Nocardioidaceae bacterium]NUS51359.1 ABC transporter ATP-binding protein [Nocardioidaceae bacterium]